MAGNFSREESHYDLPEDQIAEVQLIDIGTDDVAPVHSNLNSQPVSKMTTSEDIYAVIDKSRSSPARQVNHVPAPSEEENLAEGWKRCADDEGAYYWHVRTGSIQREKPTGSPESTLQNTPLSTSTERSQEPQSPDGGVDFLKSMESSLINLAADQISRRTESMSVSPDLHFSVHSLGWSALSEADLLTPEMSSRSVNRCIHELATGRHGGSTEGKELRLEIGESELKLVDPNSETDLSRQPIQTIRVWGVGSQNSCDFAYVARDPTTRVHRCHVFRCEVGARLIANQLKAICTRLANERKPIKSQSNIELTRSASGLPSPMDGPSKSKKCHYVGSIVVEKPTGTAVVNTAIDSIMETTVKSEWKLVSVTISPASLHVTTVSLDDLQEEETILEARLRFLSYFCISAADVKLMGTIVHTAQDEFVCHVFHCEPSAGALCKVIEAACKLRYQKLLDSKPQEGLNSDPGSSVTSPSTPTAKNSGLTATVKNIVNRFWKPSQPS